MTRSFDRAAGEGMLPCAGTTRSAAGGQNGDPAVKKLVTWLLVAFVLYLIIQFPDDSVRILDNTRSVLGRFASSGAEFVRGMLNT